jgi:hypothetical protein
LRAAGVLDRLRGEEEVLARGSVKVAVERLVAGVVGRVGGEFEEEDYAVDGVQLGEGVGVEGEEFFKLDVFDAEVVEEVGEYALEARLVGLVPVKDVRSCCVVTYRIRLDCVNG